MIEIGKRVPDFSLPATGGEIFKLSDYKGYKVVLYFYPRDNTPGCTIESQNFRDKVRSFSRCKTKIFGISRDTLPSHERFKTKQTLPFPLLSDTDETVCQMFDLMKNKTMFGKKVRGIVRSTFLIDETGKLIREWRKVNILGHVQEVLDAVKA